MAIAVMISQNIVSTSCLAGLMKDHLTKDDVAMNVITTIFRVYLTDQTMEHLAVNLKKGGIKDFLAFFPSNKRNAKTFDAHFRGAGLPQVSDWFMKRQTAAAKEALAQELKERFHAEETNEQIIEVVKEQQTNEGISDPDVVSTVWQVLMSLIDWNAVRPDQIESFAVREISKHAPIIEPFSQASKTQITLLNIVQVYCYENTKVMKAFPQILKVLYNSDCVSDQGIIYWYQKGSKPDGRQHFLKAAEPLVKALQEQEDESEEE